ncbi:26308_t:CDS:2 [Dentiscutata erythropus]|uniref:26308_t:CDS:1 n=1 Tax=Dentiscutata erythropus TaxID=1348616 RepID=A0A9N9AJR3_9GLOM|nr:26308_t:CDS:2 [Dentiscutata erythropus]
MKNLPLRNSLNTTTQHNRIVSLFITTPGGNPLTIILESDLDESTDSNFEWYTSAWKHKDPEYQFNENNSNTDEIIDEVRRQNKIIKEKLKFLSAKCFCLSSKNQPNNPSNPTWNRRRITKSSIQTGGKDNR